MTPLSPYLRSVTISSHLMLLKDPNVQSRSSALAAFPAICLLVVECMDQRSR